MSEPEATLSDLGFRLLNVGVRFVLVSARHSQDPDPWSLQSEPQFDSDSNDPPRLRIHPIEDVQPLDLQIGAFPKKTVPDALHDAVFGNCAGDAPARPTYAILDPVKLDGLAEHLENSGLEHRCLVKGQAFEEFGETAPWLVRLKPDNKFTRNLFMSGAFASGYWDTATCIFLRSDCDLDALWSHLRKFVYAQDENKKWFHTRIWDPTTAVDLFAAFFDDGLSGLFAKIDSVIVPDGNRVDILTAAGGLPREHAVVLTEAGRQRYLDRRQLRLSGQISRHFLTLPEFSGQTEDAVFIKVDHHVTNGRKTGFQEGADLFNFALGFCLCDDPNLLHAEVMRIFSNTDLSETERQKHILDRVQEPIDRAKRRAQDNEKAN